MYGPVIIELVGRMQRPGLYSGIDCAACSWVCCKHVRLIARQLTAGPCSGLSMHSCTTAKAPLPRGRQLYRLLRGIQVSPHMSCSRVASCTAAFPSTAYCFFGRASFHCSFVFHSSSGTRKTCTAECKFSCCVPGMSPSEHMLSKCMMELCSKHGIRTWLLYAVC